MRDSADMPQLQEDVTSACMNSIDDPPPRPHLFGRMNPWGIQAPLAHGRDLRGLRHDEPSRGALRVIRCRKFAGHAIRIVAVARHRCHKDPICQVQGSKLNGFEESSHWVLHVFQGVLDVLD